jgi:hypothetical protein
MGNNLLLQCPGDPINRHKTILCPFLCKETCADVPFNDLAYPLIKPKLAADIPPFIGMGHPMSPRTPDVMKNRPRSHETDINLFSYTGDI